MLVIPPTSSRTASLIGLDPGSDTLGTSRVDFDIETFALVGVSGHTLKGAKAGRGSWETEQFGERLGRISANQEALYWMFRHIQPYAVASESAFISRRRPSAYGALTEVLCSIRYALYRYDPWKVLHMYDPITVKQAVGATKFKGKDPVLDGVKAYPGLLDLYNGGTPFDQLDEHAIDAIAVALCLLHELRKEAADVPQK